MPDPDAPADHEDTDDSLEAALQRHNVEVAPPQQQRLEQYCRLLWDWNDQLNLTRHTNYEKFVSRDVIDSLQVASLLAEDEDVLDVGTGGGVPGILISILRPDVQVSLCESVGKRAAAVDQMVQELELPIPVYQARVEHILADFRFHSLVARAVGSLAKICRWVQPHWAHFDRLLLIKGPKWVEERKEARHLGLLQDLELRRAAHYPMPGTESESVILEVWRKAPE